MTANLDNSVKFSGQADFSDFEGIRVRILIDRISLTFLYSTPALSVIQSDAQTLPEGRAPLLF